MIISDITRLMSLLIELATDYGVPYRSALKFIKNKKKLEKKFLKKNFRRKTEKNRKKIRKKKNFEKKIRRIFFQKK